MHSREDALDFIDQHVALNLETIGFTCLATVVLTAGILADGLQRLSGWARLVEMRAANALIGG